MWIKRSLNVTISTISFLLIFYSTVNFMFFLSDPNYQRQKITPRKDNFWSSLSRSLVINMSLMGLFIISHSLLALLKVKQMLSSIGLDVVQRSLYIIITSVVLLGLITYWEGIPEVVIWQFDLNYKLLWWSYVLIHLFSWLLIYTGNICRDITKLIGIKGVYYNLRNWPDPNSFKSLELQQLNNHMRHPSFIAFLSLFWLVPVMSLDRLLLALIMSLYMFIAWTPDEQDYQYQKIQHTIKFHELNKLQ